MEKKKKIRILISTLLSVFSVFFTGFKTNSQDLGFLQTYSGGLPLTFFEFYYPFEDKIGLAYVVRNMATWRNKTTTWFYALDFGVLIIDIVLFYFLLKGIAELWSAAKQRTARRKDR